MAWSHVLCTTRTGAPVAEIEVSSHSWSTRMNEAGSGSSEIAVRDERYVDVGWEFATRPMRRTLVSCWDGTPVYAGLITARTESVSGGTITLQHAELRSILRRRFTRGVADYGNGVFTIAGKNGYGLAHEVLRRGLVGDSSLERWELPVSIAPGPSGGRTMVIDPVTFTTIEDSLQQVQSIGFDVHLLPRWTAAGTLEWVAQVGQRLISGDTVEWDLTASSSAASVEVTDDAAEMAGGVFVLGKGSEDAMRLGKDATPIQDDDPPALYRAVQEKDLDDQGLLDEMATQEMQQSAEPTRQWSIAARLPEEDALPLLRPGTRLRVWQRSALAGEGWKTLYVLGVRGSAGLDVTLEVQEI